MAWTDTDLPFADSPSPIAGQCSYQGAQAAVGRAETQTLRLLELYAKRGPTTDADAALALGIERSTINARRGALCRRGIVTAKGAVIGRCGVRNTTWGLA